ncbi:MAG: GGDEF domain-containing protein [Pseudomonadota bacterium]
MKASFLHKFRADVSIRDEIALINIRRAYYAALTAAPIHLAHVILFGLSQPTPTENAVKWRLGVIISHCVALLIMSLAGVLAFFLRKKAEAGFLTRAAPVAVSCVYLLLGTVLTILDQWATTGITAFLTCTLGVGLVFFIRPFLSMIIFPSIYLFFFQALQWTQFNPDTLLSERVQGLSAVGIAIFLSLMMWRNISRDISHQKLIEAKNSELAEKNRRLAFLADYDPLTGLFNRRRFQAAVEAEIARMKRSSREACLVLVDLDNFKRVNDRHGHPVGDKLLEEISKTFRENIRETDVIARLGGEEFIVLLPETSLEQGGVVAEKLRRVIAARPFAIDGREITATGSFGVARLTGSSGSSDAFSRGYGKADAALYRAKQEGRNRVHLENAGRSG